MFLYCTVSYAGRKFIPRKYISPRSHTVLGIHRSYTVLKNSRTNNNK